MDAIQSLEELSENYTAGDLSYQLHEPTSLKKIMFWINSESNSSIRLVGPILKAQRIFIRNLHHRRVRKVLSEEIIADILSGNRKLAYETIQRLTDLPTEKRVKNPDPPIAEQGEDEYDEENRNYPEAPVPIGFKKDWREEADEWRQIILNIVGSQSHNKWQNCLLSNAIIHSSRPGYPSGLYVVALTRSIMRSISEMCLRLDNRRPSDIKISGVYAHDISLSKTGHGFNTIYNAVLSPSPYFIDKSIQSEILTKGLYDLPKLVEALSRETSGFVYRRLPNEGLRLPDEWNNMFADDIREYHRGVHAQVFGQVDVPREAYEDPDSPRHQKQAVNALDI